MIASIQAKDIQIGMRTSFLGLLRVKAIARVSNGDIYYKTALGVKRVNANRIIKVNIGDKQ